MQKPASIHLEENEQQAIERVRRDIALRYLSGHGLEVGAGSRPFPLPSEAEVSYGDIRDQKSLEAYFSSNHIPFASTIDAQTFASVPAASLDFLISAHVIEHLRDPVGSLVQGLRVLKTGKPLILVVPDMRFTFDRNRPETTVEHLLRDFSDGGEGTCYQAYEEHLRYVHPYLTGQTYDEAEIAWQAGESSRRWREFDVHFHAWTQGGFVALLEAVSKLAPFLLEESAFVVNENIFVLRKS